MKADAIIGKRSLTEERIIHALNPWTPTVDLYVRVPGCQNYKLRLNPVWHSVLYSCAHMKTVGGKGLKYG